MVANPPFSLCVALVTDITGLENRRGGVCVFLRVTSTRYYLALFFRLLCASTHDGRHNEERILRGSTTTTCVLSAKAEAVLRRLRIHVMLCRWTQSSPSRSARIVARVLLLTKCRPYLKYVGVAWLSERGSGIASTLARTLFDTFRWTTLWRRVN